MRRLTHPARTALVCWRLCVNKRRTICRSMNTNLTHVCGFKSNIRPILGITYAAMRHAPFHSNPHVVLQSLWPELPQSYQSLQTPRRTWRLSNCPSDVLRFVDRQLGAQVLVAWPTLVRLRRCLPSLTSRFHPTYSVTSSNNLDPLLVARCANTSSSWMCSDLVLGMSLYQTSLFCLLWNSGLKATHQQASHMWRAWYLSLHNIWALHSVAVCQTRRIVPVKNSSN